MAGIEDRKKAVRVREFHYASAQEGTSVHAMEWLPEGAPRAQVQISHGMAEYAGRYDDFARFLAAHGYLVSANDHIGHGGTSDPSRYGCLPADGAEVMVADMRSLEQRMRNEADVPYFLFGHSMGSFLVREYVKRFGGGLDGAVVCGTGQTPLAMSKAGGALARLVGRVRGMDYKSKLVDSMGVGAYGNKVEGARTGDDWLNTDPAQVDAYIADPACGFMFSVGGYASICALTADIVTDECAAATPDGLPVLFMGGAEDPVGDFGRGVRKAADAMRRLSKARVSVRVYPGMRHEVLNEPGHARPYADVLGFLDENVAAACKARHGAGDSAGEGAEAHAQAVRPPRPSAAGRAAAPKADAAFAEEAAR